MNKFKCNRSLWFAVQNKYHHHHDISNETGMWNLRQFFYSGKNCVRIRKPLYNRPKLTLKDLCQAGPDIGDMELRRSMLEPEVGCGHFLSHLWTLWTQLQQLLKPFSSLQDEDFRPASEVFGKGGMDLDYLNQVKFAWRSGNLHSRRGLKRISLCNGGILGFCEDDC